MNKIFFILILSIFFSGNILAKTIDIVCKPDTEWDSSYKKKKIWITFNKPKFFITLDLDKMMVTKLSYSKNREKYSNVTGVILEKGSVLKDKYKAYKFIKAGELIANELYVYNLYEIIEYNDGYGLLVSQYRLNNIQITAIEKKLNKYTFSEFENARSEYETKNLDLIKFYGGMEGICN